MKTSPKTIRMRMAAVAFMVCSGLSSGQTSAEQTPSLGDVARTVRKEHASPGRVPGKQLVDEEEEGPDTTGIWRVRLCTRTPCNELSIALPKDVKWTRPKEEPRPVLIPLPGQADNASRVIRLYVAESLAPLYTPVDGAKRMFLQAWFSRPEYFGQPARISQDEHFHLDNADAVISHFSIAATTNKYHGLSVVVGTSNGSYGFACVFLAEDTPAAGSICDAIVRSARNQVLVPGQRPVYPNYEPPAYYPRYVPDETPDDDDPQ
jgi:hypothetical protein